MTPYALFWTILSPFDVAKGKACQDSNCQAARDTLCSAGAHFAREHPNSLAYRTPAARDADLRDYDRIIQSYAELPPIPLNTYCTMLTRVAAQVNGDPAHDERSIHTIIDLALRLDRPGRRCIARIKAAFPQTEAVQSQLPGVGGLCLDRPQLCYAHMDPPLRPWRRR